MSIKEAIWVQGAMDMYLTQYSWLVYFVTMIAISFYFGQLVLWSLDDRSEVLCCGMDGWCHVEKLLFFMS